MMIELRLDLFERIELDIGIEITLQHYKSEIQEGQFHAHDVVMDEIHQYMILKSEECIVSIEPLLTDLPCRWVLLYYPELGLIQLFDAHIGTNYDKMYTLYRKFELAYSEKVTILE